MMMMSLYWMMIPQYHTLYTDNTANGIALLWAPH